MNEEFFLGEDQQLAAEAIESWPIPDGQDPQEFKVQLLKKYFTPDELEFREMVITALGGITADQ